MPRDGVPAHHRGGRAWADAALSAPADDGEDAATLIQAVAFLFVFCLANVLGIACLCTRAGARVADYVYASFGFPVSTVAMAAFASCPPKLSSSWPRWARTRRSRRAGRGARAAHRRASGPRPRPTPVARSLWKCERRVTTPRARARAARRLRPRARARAVGPVRVEHRVQRDVAVRARGRDGVLAQHALEREAERLGEPPARAVARVGAPLDAAVAGANRCSSASAARRARARRRGTPGGARARRARTRGRRAGSRARRASRSCSRSARRRCGRRGRRAARAARTAPARPRPRRSLASPEPAAEAPRSRARGDEAPHVRGVVRAVRVRARCRRTPRRAARARSRGAPGSSSSGCSSTYGERSTPPPPAGSAGLSGSADAAASSSS